MMNLTKSVICLFALALAAFAAADDFDFKMADLAILQSKAVQKDMKVSEAQRARMNKFADQNRQQVTAEIKAKQAQGKQPDEKVLIGYYGQLKRNVFSVLSAGQLKRLREITLQRAGPMGLLSKALAHRVGMNEADLAKYRQYYAEGSKQANAIIARVTGPINAKYRGMKPKDKAEAQRLQQSYNAEVGAAMKKVAKQLDAIRLQTKGKMLKLVTAKETAIWNSLMGAKFSG